MGCVGQVMSACNGEAWEEKITRRSVHESSSNMVEVVGPGLALKGHVRGLGVTSLH